MTSTPHITLTAINPSNRFQRRCQVKRTICRTQHSTVCSSGTSAVSLKCTVASSCITEAPQVDPGCTWHVVAQSNLHCIWFALRAPVELHPTYTDKLWAECGWISLFRPASPSFSPLNPPFPSHLFQLSNHPMTFKGAWHPFEVGEEALALVSCPNPTQANKMHAGLQLTKGIPVH